MLRFCQSLYLNKRIDLHFLFLKTARLGLWLKIMQNEKVFYSDGIYLVWVMYIGSNKGGLS